MPRRVALAALTSLALFGAVACSGTDAEAPPPDEAAVDATAEPAAEDPGEQAPSGTMDDPLPFGTEVTGDGATGSDWTATIPSTPTEGWTQIQAKNPQAVAPDDGMELWLVPISGTYNGTSAAPAATYSYIKVGFIADDGTVFEGGSSLEAGCKHNYVPDDVMDVKDIAPGATFTGNLCVQIPVGATGVWTLAIGLMADPVYFTGN